MNQFVLLRVLFWHCEWNLKPQHTRALSEYCWKSLPFASLYVKMIERYKYSVIYLVKLQSVCSYYSRYSGFNTESIEQSNNLFVAVVAFVYPQYSHSKFMNRLSKIPGITNTICRMSSLISIKIGVHDVQCWILVYFWHCLFKLIFN